MLLIRTRAALTGKLDAMRFPRLLVVFLWVVECCMASDYADFSDAFEYYSISDVTASVIVRDVSVSLESLQAALGDKLPSDINYNIDSYSAAITAAIMTTLRQKVYSSESSSSSDSQTQTHSYGITDGGTPWWSHHTSTDNGSFATFSWHSPAIMSNTTLSVPEPTAEPSSVPTAGPTANSTMSTVYSTGYSDSSSSGGWGALAVPMGCWWWCDPAPAPTSVPTIFMASSVDLVFNLNISCTLAADLAAKVSYDTWASNYANYTMNTTNAEPAPTKVSAGDVLGAFVQEQANADFSAELAAAAPAFFQSSYVSSDELVLTPTSTSDFQHSSESLRFYLLGDWGKGGIYYDKTQMDDDGDEEDKNREREEEEREEEERGEEGVDHDHRRRLPGGNKGTYQLAIGRVMAGYTSTQSHLLPAFLLALGDNFYDDGVQSANDSMWSTHWSQVYHGTHSELAMKWYGVVGNHDWGYGWTGVQAQIDRTTATDDDMWEMPSTNYTRIIELAGGQGSLVIVSVDTTTLAPDENEATSSESWDDTIIDERITKQLVRTERGLKYAWANAPRPMWIVMAGHYPIYSSGEHGDNDDLVSALQPLLDSYKVHMYYCGHDHMSAHYSYSSNASINSSISIGDKWTTHHFIAGGGALTDEREEEDTSATAHWAGMGYSSFASVSLNSKQMHVAYRDIDGKVVYSYELNNPHTESSDRSGSSLADQMLTSSAQEQMQLFAGLATLFLFIAVLALAGTDAKMAAPSSVTPGGGAGTGADEGQHHIGGRLSTFSAAPEYTALRFV